MMASEKKSEENDELDQEAVSKQIIDYYKKYSLSRELPKYFSGSSVSYIPEPVVDNERTDEIPYKQVKGMELPIISVETEEEELEDKPVSPSSSTISTRKLEWDSGADIGYANCEKNTNILHKSSSLPTVFTETKKNEEKTTQTQLGNQILRITSNSSSSDNLTNNIPVETSSSSSSAAEKPPVLSSSSSSNLLKPSSTSSSLATTLAFIKTKIGDPDAESTPIIATEVTRKPNKDYFQTPIVTKNRKPEQTKRIFELCRTNAIVIECIDVRKMGSDKNIQTSLLSEQQNEAIQTSDSLLQNIETPPEPILANQSVIIIDDSEENSKKSTSNQQSSSDAYSLRSDGFEYVASNQIPEKSATSSDLSSIPILAQLISQKQSNSLVGDVDKSLEILQKLLKSRKYDDATKKRYIRKIVQKIIDSKYSDESTTSSELFLPKRDQKLNENLPWFPPQLSKFTVKTTTDEFLPEREEQKSPKKRSIFTATKPVEYSETTLEKSASLQSWKEDKTMSEQLLERKTQYGQGDQLVKFAMKERQHQIAWINDEISHLTKLKGLLEQNQLVSTQKTTTVYMLSQKSNGSNSNSKRSNRRNYVIETELPSGSSSDSIDFRFRDKSVAENFNVREMRPGRPGKCCSRKILGNIEVVSDDKTTNIKVKTQKVGQHDDKKIPSLVGKGKYDTFPMSQRERVDRCFPCGMPKKDVPERCKPCGMPKIVCKTQPAKSYTIDIPLSQIRSTLTNLNEISAQKLSNMNQCKLIHCQCKMNAQKQVCSEQIQCEFGCTCKDAYKNDEIVCSENIQCDLGCTCKSKETKEKIIGTQPQSSSSKETQKTQEQKSLKTQYDNNIALGGSKGVQVLIPNKNKDEFVTTEQIPMRNATMQSEMQAINRNIPTQYEPTGGKDVNIETDLRRIQDSSVQCSEDCPTKKAKVCDQNIQCEHDCNCKLQFNTISKRIYERTNIAERKPSTDSDVLRERQAFHSSETDELRRVRFDRENATNNENIRTHCNRKTQCRLCDEIECARTTENCTLCRQHISEAFFDVEDSDANLQSAKQTNQKQSRKSGFDSHVVGLKEQSSFPSEPYIEKKQESEKYQKSYMPGADMKTIVEGKTDFSKNKEKLDQDDMSTGSKSLQKFYSPVDMFDMIGTNSFDMINPQSSTGAVPKTNVRTEMGMYATRSSNWSGMIPTGAVSTERRFSGVDSKLNRKYSEAERRIEKALELERAGRSESISDKTDSNEENNRTTNLRQDENPDLSDKEKMAHKQKDNLYPLKDSRNIRQESGVYRPDNKERGSVRQEPGQQRKDFKDSGQDLARLAHDDRKNDARQVPSQYRLENENLRNTRRKPGHYESDNYDQIYVNQEPSKYRSENEDLRDMGQKPGHYQTDNYDQKYANQEPSQYQSDYKVLRDLRQKPAQYGSDNYNQRDGNQEPSQYLSENFERRDARQEPNQYDARKKNLRQESDQFNKDSEALRYSKVESDRYHTDNKTKKDTRKESSSNQIINEDQRNTGQESDRYETNYSDSRYSRRKSDQLAKEDLRDRGQKSGGRPLSKENLTKTSQQSGRYQLDDKDLIVGQKSEQSISDLKDHRDTEKDYGQYKQDNDNQRRYRKKIEQNRKTSADLIKPRESSSLLEPTHENDRDIKQKTRQYRSFDENQSQNELVDHQQQKQRLSNQSGDDFNHKARRISKDIRSLSSSTIQNIDIPSTQQKSNINRDGQKDQISKGYVDMSESSEKPTDSDDSNKNYVGEHKNLSKSTQYKASSNEQQSDQDEVLENQRKSEPRTKIDQVQNENIQKCPMCCDCKLYRNEVKQISNEKSSFTTLDKNSPSNRPSFDGKQNEHADALKNNKPNLGSAQNVQKIATNLQNERIDSREEANISSENIDTSLDRDMEKRNASPPSSSSTSLSSTTSSESSTDSEPESYSSCLCCKRNRLPSKTLYQLRDTINNEVIPLCRPCYRGYQHAPQNPQNNYANPTHVCCCYSLINKQTLAEIKKTINDLNEINNDCFCSCVNVKHGNLSKYCKYCKCKLRKTAKNQNGIAYMLTFEEMKAEDIRKEMEKEEKRKKKPLEEIKIKIPVAYKKKHKDKVNKKKKMKKKEESENVETTNLHSLQEYLEKNRPNFIQIAEGRRKSLMDSRYSREENSETRKMQFLLTYQPNSVPYQKSTQGRIFTAREMREINQKNYRKLPEVQQKLVDNKEKQLREANRLIADTFNRKLRDNVLKGKLTISADINVVNL